MYRIFAVTTLIFMSILITNTATPFKTSSDVTPSPAPSKTPPTPPEVTAQATAIDEQSTENPIEPFTQSDLFVLTGNVQRPNAATWHNNNLYTVCSGDWTIYELEDTTGSTETYIYGIRNAHTLYIENLPDTEIAIWVPDYNTNSLLRVNQNRSPQTITTNLEGPWGIAFLDDENFLITNLTGNNIKLASRGGETRELVTELRSPTGIAIDEEQVYVANNGSARRSIEWISKEELLESEEPTLQPLVGGLQNTTGLVFASDGMLYFAYALGTRGVVGRINPEVCREQGGCTNDQVEIVLYTELAAPLAGLTISEDMRLFVHTIFRPEIYWVQLDEAIRNQ